MITLHWFTFYCVVAWVWAASCWYYERETHPMPFWDSVSALILAPAYFWLALLIVGVEYVASLARS